MTDGFGEMNGEVGRATVCLLTELCRISSESGNVAGLGAVAARLAEELERRGMTTEIQAITGPDGSTQPVLFARGPGLCRTSGDRPLLLVGHLDTVLPAIEPVIQTVGEARGEAGGEAVGKPASDSGGETRGEPSDAPTTAPDGAASVATASATLSTSVAESTPPAGRRLRGTGALDMKGGLAMFVGALDLLAARGEAPPDDLLLVAVPDEEVAGDIGMPVVRAASEVARAVLVLEPGERHGEVETLVAGRRGLSEWSLEARGRAAHSGLAYWQGRSALAAAAEWCQRAQALSRPDGGPTVNVGRLAAGTSEFVDDLAHHHDLLGSTRQCNVVPERARAEGEARFLAPADRDRILAALAALADEVAAAHDVEVTFTVGAGVPPVDPRGPGAALVARTVALAAARGLALAVETDRGGISFPNYLTDPTRVAVIDGLGPVGDGMHTRDEWVDLDSLARRTVLLADLLATLRRPAAVAGPGSRDGA